MRRQRWAVLVALAGLTAYGASAAAQGRGMGMGAGMRMAQRDSATVAQMQVIHEMVVNNAKITRTVTNLPDGIRTVTESSDPRLASFIRDHVVTMDQRINAGDDPGLPMESPALRSLFVNKDKIRTTMDSTPSGIVVVQTSTDSSVVAALQKHAAEVSDLAARGMAAMHEAMMKNMPGMMMDSMPPKRPPTR